MNGDICSWKEKVVKTRSWKVRMEVGKKHVGKFESKLKYFSLLNTALETFQLRMVLSNLNGNFLTSNFPTSRFFQLFFPSSFITLNELDEMSENENSSPEIV